MTTATQSLLLSLAILSPCLISITVVGSSPSCSHPLGMEDGRIGDTQLSASSSYQDMLVGASKGRLNSEAGGGAWCPRSVINSQEDKQQYLEIDLLVDHVITSILIQGRFANGLGQEFTEYYKLQFWREGFEEFVKYEKGEAGELLRGNTDTYQVVEEVLDGPEVIASRVRIIPFSHHPRTVCLRAELKGCPYVGILTSNLNVSSPNTTLPKKTDVEDWNESIYLGAAVGILVTVVIAAVSAVALVLVRNSWQKKNLSELSSCSSSLDTGPRYSRQSSLAYKGRHQPDVVQGEKIRVPYKQITEKDILMLDRMGRKDHIFTYNPSEASVLNSKQAQLSLPPLSPTSRHVFPLKSVSNPGTFLPNKNRPWFPSNEND